MRHNNFKVKPVVTWLTWSSCKVAKKLLVRNSDHACIQAVCPPLLGCRQHCRANTLRMAPTTDGTPFTMRTGCFMACDFAPKQHDTRTFVLVALLDGGKYK